MADLDTRNKRGSAIGIDQPWNHIYPDPDGVFSQADRQQIGYKYQGILSGGAGASLIPRLCLLGAG